MKKTLALLICLTATSCAPENTGLAPSDSELLDGGDAGSGSTGDGADQADGEPWTDAGDVSDPDSGGNSQDARVAPDVSADGDGEDGGSPADAASPGDAASPDASGPPVGKCGKVPSWCETEVFDAHGRTILTATDYDCDGDTDHPSESCTRYERTYDGGRVVGSRIGTCGEPPTTCLSSTGIPGEVQTQTRDHGCDGPSPTDECRVSNPQEDGSTLETWDLGCDGVPDDCQVTRWEPADGLGGTERVDKNLDCDGSPDICWTTVTDPEGRTLTSQGDEGCDGVPEICHTYVWGDESLPSTYTYDAECDGPGPGDTCYTTTFDAEGKKTLVSDSACDGTPDTCLLEWYDASGLVVETGMDGDCDGTADSCVLVSHEAP